MPYFGTPQPNDVKENTGLYTPNQILDLTSKGHWGGSLEHIETITASSSAALDFLNLGNFKVHVLTLDDFQCTTNTTRYAYGRVSTDGGSSFVTSTSYSRCWQRVQTNGSNVNQIKSTTETSMTNFFSVDSDDTTASSVIYFYNLLSSTARTSVTFQSWNPVGQYIYFGMFMVNITEAHNAFRIFPSGDAFATGRAKLYGFKEL
jgi:hypothetical protein